MIDEFDLPLPASNSLGLDVLPAQPAPVEDKSVPASASSLGLTGGGGTSGLGLADYKRARSEDELAYLQNLPTMQKVGLVLESFGAAVNGQQNPVDRLLENKRKREVEFRNELGTTIQTVKAGMDLAAKVPAGKARDALIEQLSRSSGTASGIVREALGVIGTEQEKRLRDTVSVLENPAAREMLITAVSGAQDPRAAADKLLTDSDFMKRLEQRADQVTLPRVTGKLAVISRTLAKMPKYQAGEGASTFTLADLREVNRELPKELQITDAEFGTITRNQAALIPYGLKTDATLQAEQAAGASRQDKGTWSEPYRLDGVLVQKNSVTGEIRTAVSRPPREPAEKQPDLKPIVVEVADPDNPGKNIKIDARTGNRIGASPNKHRPLPAPLQKQLTEAAELADATDRFVTRFKDSYGGHTAIGDLPVRAGKLFGDDTGATQWWQDYELHQSVIRNKLFGAALTKPEIEAWEKSAINPRMSVKEIKKNLAHRANLERLGMERLMKGAVTSGYRKEEVEAYTGRTVSEGSTPAAGGGPKKITTEAEYAALPAGAEYIDPDGNRRRKK